MTPPEVTASLSAADPSVRLRAALAARSAADPDLLDALVERGVRCAWGAFVLATRV